MIIEQPKIFKLLVVTLTLCCLTTSVVGGKLSKNETKVNGTDVAASAKTIVKATTEAAAAAIKETKNKDTEEVYDEEDNDTSEVKDEKAEKNAIQPATDTSLSVWSLVSGLWNWIKDDISESLFGDDGKTTAVGEGRTFGKIRRLQMALIPIVFKFGVLSAMMTFLVAVGIKTLFLVKVLIVMNLLALLAKFFTFKSHLGNVEHFSAPPAPMWNPYISTGWHSPPEEHHINKEIHLHIHNGGHLQPQVSSYSTYGSGISGQSQGWEKRSDPYSAYDNIALQGQQNEFLANELPTTVNSIANKGQQYGRSFPGNHRMF